MVAHTDRLITIAALVLAISGAVLGVLSLVAILWLPSGDGPEAQLSPRQGAPETGGLVQTSPPGRGEGAAREAPDLAHRGGTGQGSPPAQAEAPEPAGHAAPGDTPDTGRGKVAVVPRAGGPADPQPSPSPARPGPARMAHETAADTGPEPGATAPPPTARAATPEQATPVPAASPRTPGPEAPAQADPSASAPLAEAAIETPAEGPQTPGAQAVASGAPLPADVGGATAAPGAGAVVELAKPKVDKPRVDKPAPTPLRDTAWILAQDPSRYTVQIMAVRDLADLRRFARKGRVDLELAYYRVARKGQPWFILVGGVYEDRKAAAAAVRGLPDSLRRNSPWIRTMKSVHREIRGAQGT